MAKKEIEEVVGEVEQITLRKVKNGYVIGVTTESEDYEVICSKRVHVIKILKEIFSE